MYKISNIKLSCKLQEISLHTVENICKTYNINTKQYNNFIVIKTFYTFIIFKKGNKTTNHLNITKIPNLSEIFFALIYIQNLLETKILTYVIDNITATYQIKNVNFDETLNNLKNSTCNIQYNNDVFPGIFIKLKTGTGILFHSGKIVLIGCKSIYHLECLMELINAHIKI